jgi:nucleoside-diphosphate-sugar epimerase
VTIIRFGGLIGKQRHPARFLSGKTDVKEPKAPVNLIHIVDCVGLINAIVTQECWGETFNGCASLHPEKKLFYEEVCNRMKITPPIFEDNHSVLNPQVGKRVDNQKSKEMLNYKYEFENPLDMWSEVTNN